jgi:hypothetical protein
MVAASLAITGIIYEAADQQPLGRFSGLPARSGEADPALIAAVNDAGNIINFLRDMVARQVSGGYRWARFIWAWRQKPSHDYVTRQVRGVSPTARSSDSFPSGPVRRPDPGHLEIRDIDPRRPPVQEGQKD